VLHGGVLGNLIGRLSREVSRERPSIEHQHHTAGRGGLGNTHAGGTNNKIDRLEEEERSAHRSSLDDGGAHTSGRGGYGNTSATAGTGGYDTQAPTHAAGEHHAFASGRGGIGNIQNGD